MLTAPQYSDEELLEMLELSVGSPFADENSEHATNADGYNMATLMIMRARPCAPISEVVRVRDLFYKRHSYPRGESWEWARQNRARSQ